MTAPHVSPICPRCRRYVLALVRGTAFETSGQAEGFCEHTPAERAEAQRQEDAAHDATVHAQGDRALPAMERHPGTTDSGGSGL